MDKRQGVTFHSQPFPSTRLSPFYSRATSTITFGQIYGSVQSARQSVSLVIRWISGERWTWFRVFLPAIEEQWTRYKLMITYGPCIKVSSICCPHRITVLFSGCMTWGRCCLVAVAVSYPPKLIHNHLKTLIADKFPPFLGSPFPIPFTLPFSLSLSLVIVSLSNS